MKNNEREYRSIILECRAAAEGNEDECIVEGYATTFNQPYVLYSFDDYTVREQVDPHAFDKCDMSDVIMQYDHKGRVYARQRNKTLELTIDNIGLKIRAKLGGTEEGKKLYNEIKGGYTDRMSMGFVVAEDKVEKVSDKTANKVDVLRTILSVSKLYDVSAVSIPANDKTSISARSFSDGVIAEVKAERLNRERLKLKLKLI